MLGNVDALAARLTAIVEHADEAAQAEKAKRDEYRAAQTARKETLAAEAEDLATNSTQWKAAGDRLREILEEWRTISGLDRKTDDALWKRYSTARETFNRRRGSHFAELDRERAGARQAKEALCERAEELADSTRLGRRPAPFSATCSRSGRPPDAPPRTSTTRCGSGSRPRRTPSFLPAMPPAPSATPSSGRTSTQRRRCSQRPKRSTPPTRMRRGRRCARSATSGTRSARCPANGAPSWSDGCAPIEKKVRDAPTGGVDPEAQARADQFRARAEQFERQAEKAAAAGRTKDAEEARANAEQWRQWADAAAEALGRRG